MSTTPNIEAVLRKLRDYLLEEIAIQDVVLNFPEPTQALKYPMISIIRQGNAQLVFDAAGTFVLDTGDVVDTGTEEEPNRQAEVIYRVGTYNIELQLDLWCASKSKLETLYETLMDVMNPDLHPMGLTLTLDEYHDRPCHYVITGYNTASFGEQNAQRGTWRAIVGVLATCDAVKTKSEFLMETLETTIETPDTIEDEDEIIE
jgi:hypothetical protein